MGEPKIDARNWRIEILYHAEKLCGYSLDELKRRPQSSVEACLVRHDNTGVCGKFEGISLKELVSSCIDDKNLSIDRIVFIGADGYESSMDFSELADDWIIAFKVDGRPLTKDEGAPARIIIPGRYGYKWVRWLSKIVLIRGEHYGLWEFIGRDNSGKVPRHIYKRIERSSKGSGPHSNP